MVELFFVPGTTLVGLIGFGLGIWGIGIAFSTYGAVGGTITALATAAIGLLMAWMGVKSGMWRRYSLHTKLDQPVALPDISILEVGDEGQTLSDLRPSGNAVFKGKVYTVATLGRQVPAGSRVRIIAKQDFRLVVEAI